MAATGAEASNSLIDYLPQGAAAPNTLLNDKKKDEPASSYWYILGGIIAFFTTVNYGFTSAAYARKAYDAPEEQWGWGAYYVTCAVLANIFFDLMASREDIGKQIEDFYTKSIRPFFAVSRKDKAATVAWSALSLVVAYCAFNTSFTTKIPGQEGIAAFDDVLPPWLSFTFQIMNDIYSGLFVTALFVSGSFQLPKLIWDAIVWKKDQTGLEKTLQTSTLLGGAIVGAGAYLVFLNTLWNFPENKINFTDPFNDYLKTVILAWRGFAAIFPLTRGAFCVLNAQRGAEQLLLQLYALFKTGVNELLLRVAILAFTGVVAYGSIGPSIFQAVAPQEHQIGNQEILKNLIIACAFFVNALGVAKRLHNACERRAEADKGLITDASSDSPVDPEVGYVTDALLASDNKKNQRSACSLTPLSDILHSVDADKTNEATTKTSSSFFSRIFCCSRRRDVGQVVEA